MSNSYKVIVAHSGKQHSFQSACSLKRNNMLFKYATTVYDKSGSLTRFFKNFLNGDLRKKADTRSTTLLDESDVIQFCEFLGLFLIFVSKVTNNSKIKYFINSVLINSFGKKVAKYAIKNKVDAVICYDTNSNKLFKILEKKAPHIKRIMDVSAPTRLYTKYIFEKEISKYSTTEFYKYHSIFFNKKILDKSVDEIEHTNDFIVASSCAIKSLEFCNVDNSNIYLVPYGTNLNQFCSVNRIYKKPLKLIYVGNITYRKGIHHLLKIVSMYDENDIILNIIGDYHSNIEIYNKYKDKKNIIFHGFVTRDKIAKTYQDSDVFVFPTLVEGFGLVVLEAMACGLPVIISENSCGKDIVKDYYNGIIIDPLDETSLKNSIDWFLNNTQKIEKMSINAINTSKEYDWNNYYSNYSCTVKKIIDNSDR